jgi:kinesin family protein 5
LLSKANISNAKYQKYIEALEAELAIWRSGATVEHSEWATPDKAPSTTAAPKKPTSAGATPAPSTPARSMTPVIPALEGLKGDLDSRPQTPTVVALDKDEREDFLRRENELTDALGEKESALAAAEKLVKELKEELAFLKEQETSVSSVS